jgi:CRISPR-associated protein Csb2
MLILDVEFLLGVCFAARRPSDPEPDWPPQPDRVFSALVATWAARGEQAAERAALEWLEKLDAPTVRASAIAARAVSTVFVPPNDARGTQTQVLPALRRRQERRFPAAIPRDRTISYSWRNASINTSTFEALQALARDTSYLGHSASLVRCYFRDLTDQVECSNEQPSRLRVYPGRVAELQAAFNRGERPSPGEHTRSVADSLDPAAAHEPEPQSVFGRDWLVFGDAGGECPDLRSAAVVTRAFRAAIMSGFDGGVVPEIISGHTAEGQPSNTPHMAIFPLANLGWKWADGRLMGLAVCLPRRTSVSERESLLRAVTAIIRAHGDVEHGEVQLALAGAPSWRLVMQNEPSVSSLKPCRYLRSATTWATATPIALDRHPKEKEHDALQGEICSIIADACTRTGLRRPVMVVPDTHSAIRGTFPARPSPRSPPWMRWAVAGALQGRVLTHATLVFDQEVQGPVVLGAGRYFGLGLCLPLDEEIRI